VAVRENGLKLQLGQHIPIHQVLCEGGDEVCPLSPVAGRRDVGIIVAPGRVSTREQTGHEADLHERPHTHAQKSVEDAVNVEKRPHQTTAVEGRQHHAHVVDQQAVEADTLESQVAANCRQLALVVRSKRERGVAGANTLLEEVVPFARHIRGIHRVLQLSRPESLR
jgi:hypothetical protein